MTKLGCGVLAGCLILAGACAGADGASQTDDVTADAAPAPAAATDGLVAGTPPGGLEDWVSQVEAGLDELKGQLGNDLEAAQRTALDLYVGRQEYIEMYWGAQGRLRGEGTEDLSGMVLSAEDAFHDLLQKLAVQPVSGEEIGAITDTIKARLGRVVAEAHARGVPLIPPGNPSVPEGSRP